MKAIISTVRHDLLNQTDCVFFLLQGENATTNIHNFMTAEARIAQLRGQHLADKEINRMMIPEVAGKVYDITICENGEEVLKKSREYYTAGKSLHHNMQAFGRAVDGRHLWKIEVDQGCMLEIDFRYC